MLSRVKTSSSFFAKPIATRFDRPDRLERRVGGVQLAFAAIDHDQIRKGSAILEHLRIATPDDLLHRGEIVEKPSVLLPRSFGEPGFQRASRLAGLSSRSVLDLELPVLGTAASGLLRTPPSTRPSHCPESWRCRSSRCGAAASAIARPPATTRALRSCAVAFGIEAGAIAERGVAMREFHHPLLRLRAAARRCGPCARPSARASLRAACCSVERDRHVNLRRRLLIGVELLDRGLDARLARARATAPLCPLSASHTNSTRSMTRPPRTMNTWTIGAAGADLDAEHVAIAELRGRHLLLPLAKRCTVRIASRSCAASSIALAARRPRPCGRAAARPVRRCGLPETAACPRPLLHSAPRCRSSPRTARGSA